MGVSVCVCLDVWVKHATYTLHVLQYFFISSVIILNKLKSACQRAWPRSARSSHCRTVVGMDRAGAGRGGRGRDGNGLSLSQHTARVKAYKQSHMLAHTADMRAGKHNLIATHSHTHTRTHMCNACKEVCGKCNGNSNRAIKLTCYKCNDTWALLLRQPWQP